MPLNRKNSDKFQNRYCWGLPRSVVWGRYWNFIDYKTRYCSICWRYFRWEYQNNKED